MYIVEEILRAMPDLKVIYSVRDPRGILSSRSVIWEDLNLKSAAENLCLRLKTDYEQYEKMRRHFKDRILQITYEDLANQPRSVAERIYRFVERSIQPEVLRWLDRNTKAKVTDHHVNDLYGTARNARQRINAWRASLPHDIISHANAVCSETLEKLGYSP